MRGEYANAMSAANLAAAFDPRSNALNAMRLGLATMVIIGHAAIVGGYPFSNATITLFGEVAVDGFFAISGFLITRSWYRRQVLGRYLWHRFLRIFPAFWVCLVVVAFVLAPIGVALQGFSLSEYWGATAGPWSYLTHNFTLWIGQEGIAGTPNSVPFPGVWDAPLWTLYWEFLAYLFLAVLGVFGVVSRRRWVVLLLALVLWLITVWRSVVPGAEVYFEEFAADVIPRLLLMFLLGAALYLYAAKVPMQPLLAASAALLVAAGLFSGWEYRVLGALPLAYLVMWLGCRLPVRWGMRNDISYGLYIYAFPVQQLLVIAGWSAIGWWASAALAVVLTVPLAWLSWLAVERPALRLKNWTPGRGPAPVDPQLPPAPQGRSKLGAGAAGAGASGVGVSGPGTGGLAAGSVSSEAGVSDESAASGDVAMPEAVPTGSSTGPATVPRISGVWGDKPASSEVGAPRPPGAGVGVAGTALIAIGLFTLYASLMLLG